MPWRIERRNNQYCVIKETDNTTVACHTTQAEALSHQRALYANEPTTKAASSFLVFKDATGRYRWIGFSSNAYQDRDNEIVSTKALETDVKRADTDGDYGPLRWWHVQGLDIGDCDYNAMHGRVLIESGTFKEEWIGNQVKNNAHDLQLSIGFMHPVDEPDHEGVFHHIRRFERSLVPAGKAANPWTRFFVQEANSMVKEKIQEFMSRFGATEKDVEEFLGQAEITEKSAQSAGVAFKADEEVAAEEIAAAPVIEVEEEKLIEPPVVNGMVSVGAMAPEDFKLLMAESLAQAMEPLIGALNFEAKMRPMLDEAKSLFGQISAKKDADIAEQAERISALETTQKEAAAVQQELAENLKELTGDQPRAEKRGYRASQDPQTVTSEKSAEPQADASFSDFVENFLKAA